MEIQLKFPRIFNYLHSRYIQNSIEIKLKYIYLIKFKIIGVFLEIN